MTRTLPEKPNLDFLKKQAKVLKRAHKQQSPEAAQRIQDAQPGLNDLSAQAIFDRKFSIIDAQHVVAREYDFPSWAKLKQYVESVSGISRETLIKQFKTAVNNLDPEAIRELGKEHDLSDIVNEPYFIYGDPAILFINVISNEPIPMAEALLEVGADINAQTADPERAYRILHYCLWKRDYNIPFDEVIQFYLSKGIIVDPWAATGLGDVELLKSFIKKDPTLVNSKGNGGKTLLHYARQKEIIDYLLELGADINARCKIHGGTPVQYSILQKEACSYFIEKGAITDVFIACQLNDLATLKKLYHQNPDCIHEQVGKGAHADKGAKHGQLLCSMFPIATHPITLAYNHKNKKAYSFILNQCTEKQKLTYAATCGDTKTIEELIKGQNISTSQIQNQLNVALNNACESDNLNAVKTLLGTGATAHGSENSPYYSPLHLACYKSCKAIVEHLLKFNPKINLKLNFFGQLPRQSFISFSSKTPQKLTPLECMIYSIGRDYRSPEDTIAITKMLLNAGAEVDQALVDFAPKYLKEILRTHLTK